MSQLAPTTLHHPPIRCLCHSYQPPANGATTAAAAASASSSSSSSSSSSPPSSSTAAAANPGDDDDDDDDDHRKHGTPSPLALPPHFEAVVRRLLTDLKKELGDALLGVLLGGSSATGEIHATSDVDLFVIHAAPKRQRRLLRIHPASFVPPMRPPQPQPSNAATRPIKPVVTSSLPAGAAAPPESPVPFIEAEVFINPPSRMTQEITSLEDPTVHVFRLGHILLDTPTGTVRALQRLARETYAKGRPRALDVWTPYQLAWARYQLVDQLNDTWDAIEAGDAASGTATLLRTLASALDVLYDTHGWWRVKEKKRLRDLAEKRANGDHVAKRVLPLVKRISRGDLESVERHKSLSELVDVVLEPLGGRMEEWVTEWEDV